jgi:hypothetical protein
MNATKKFDMEKKRPILPFTVKHTSLTLPSIGEFRAYGLKVDFDVHLDTLGVNLQRPFVWKLHQKQAFILSILKGMSIPQFAVVIYTPNEKERHSVYKIVDGKQRLSSLFAFVDGKFPIPCDGEDFYFDELPEDVQRRLMRWSPTAQVAYSYYNYKISDAGLVLWFYLLNFEGTKQDATHIEKLMNRVKH